MIVMSTPSLLDQLRRLKPSELSVLRATLDTPGSQIATVAGTANDAFWTTMVERGFAKEMTLEIGPIEGLPDFRPRSFALTEHGRAVVADLLRDL
jgi:hypothetical protein